VSKPGRKRKGEKRSDSPRESTEPEVVLEGEVLPAETESEHQPGADDPVESELVEIAADELHADAYEADEVSDSTVKSAAPVRYSPLDAYFSEIRRFGPLSKEDEHTAAVEYAKTKSADAAYTLVSGSLWLVVKIARDYERVAKNILDLIQEGNIGLMEAVRNFDPYRGVRFPSYAVWWIRAYIIRYIISNWRMVKIGTTQAQRKLFFNLKKESERLEREGIYPSTKLLADRLNVKEGEVIEMSQRLGGSDMSVDAPLKDDNDANLLSVIPSGEESAEDRVAKRQLHDALVSSLSEFESTLSEKECRIFHGRVLDEDKKTLQELSDELSISKERVRQIENKLREKARAFVAKKLGSEIGDWVDR
jgi:RNA polymerase sigma-32 factor